MTAKEAAALTDISKTVHRLEIQLTRVEEKVAAVEAAVETKVNKERFSPVEKIAYGVVALILAAVMGAGMKGLLDDNDPHRPRSGAVSKSSVTDHNSRSGRPARVVGIP